MRMPIESEIITQGDAGSASIKGLISNDTPADGLFIKVNGV